MVCNMEQGEFETLVVFRKYRSSCKNVYIGDPPYDIVALFPEISGSYADPNICMCYEHIGQHGQANYYYCVHELTSPAKPEEYEDLKKELESIGYKLKIRQKWDRRHR
jgi:hypothetical protein